MLDDLSQEKRAEVVIGGRAMGKALNRAAWRAALAELVGVPPGSERIRKTRNRILGEWRVHLNMGVDEMVSRAARQSDFTVPQDADPFLIALYSDVISKWDAAKILGIWMYVNCDEADAHDPVSKEMLQDGIRAEIRDIAEKMEIFSRKVDALARGRGEDA